MAIDMNDVMKLMNNSGALGQVAEMLGVDEKAANNAIDTVLPMLLKGMQSQAKSKETKDGFIKALDDHGKNDPKDVKKFLKNVDTDDGAKIVNHLLGSKTEDVAAKAGKKSGLDVKTILKIMAIVAPLLMSQMGKEAKTETAKSGSGDMSGIVGNLLENVDVGDVIKIANLLMK